MSDNDITHIEEEIYYPKTWKTVFVTYPMWFIAIFLTVNLFLDRPGNLENEHTIFTWIAILTIPHFFIKPKDGLLKFLILWASYISIFTFVFMNLK